ncbi:MAG: hypothetical protein AAGE52_37375 [Myxococcota bacterium]
MRPKIVRLDQLLLRLRRFEGEVRIHEGSRVHRLLLRQGRPVAAFVAGHFDPLLARLRSVGALADADHQAALAALAQSEHRSGEIARRNGATQEDVRRELARQLQETLALLDERLQRAGEVELQKRRIRANEVTGWLPRPAERASEPKASYRRSVLALHPDRLGHLSEEERNAATAELARLNAERQGL